MADFKNIKGGKELQAFLDQLPAKVEQNILRSALRQGAKVIAEEAKANAPVKDGDLRRSIKVSVRVQRGVVTAKVKAGDEKAWYAHFVEFGTRPHLISVSEDSRPGRMTRRGFKPYSLKTLNKMMKNGSLKIGQNFVGASVSHPGAQAKPYMRPALDTKTDEALKAIGEQIKKRLTKQGLNAADVDFEVEV